MIYEMSIIEANHAIPVLHLVSMYSDFWTSQYKPVAFPVDWTPVFWVYASRDQRNAIHTVTRGVTVRGNYIDF